MGTPSITRRTAGRPGYEHGPGRTWAYGARFFDRLHGVAVGETAIRADGDGGATWQTMQPQGSGQRLWDVEYADANMSFLRATMA